MSHTYEPTKFGEYQKHGDLDWIHGIKDGNNVENGFKLVKYPVVQKVDVQMDKNGIKAIKFSYEKGGANASRSLISDFKLKKGMVIDRYGENGRFVSPVIDGKPFAYEQRAIPYAPGTKKYHQYRVKEDITLEIIEDRIEKLSTDELNDLYKAMNTHHFNEEDMANFKIGPIQEGFNSVEGGIQIQAATTMEMYEMLGLLEEIK